MNFGEDIIKEYKETSKRNLGEVELIIIMV